MVARVPLNGANWGLPAVGKQRSAAGKHGGKRAPPTASKLILSSWYTSPAGSIAYASMGYLLVCSTHTGTSHRPAQRSSCGAAGEGGGRWAWLARRAAAPSCHGCCTASKGAARRRQDGRRRLTGSQEPSPTLLQIMGMPASMEKGLQGEGGGAQQTSRAACLAAACLPPNPPPPCTPPLTTSPPLPRPQRNDNRGSGAASTSSPEAGGAVGGGGPHAVRGPVLVDAGVVQEAGLVLDLRYHDSQGIRSEFRYCTLVVVESCRQPRCARPPPPPPPCYAGSPPASPLPRTLRVPSLWMR